jgi:hypothetical protein
MKFFLFTAVAGYSWGLYVYEYLSDDGLRSSIREFLEKS